jgi:hypothetical protein
LVDVIGQYIGVEFVVGFVFGFVVQVERAEIADAVVVAVEGIALVVWIAGFGVAAPAVWHGALGAVLRRAALRWAALRAALRVVLVEGLGLHWFHWRSRLWQVFVVEFEV